MDLLAQAPALPIIIPLLIAPLTALAQGPRTAHAIASLTALIAFAACAFLLLQVVIHGPIAYHMGDWAPPIGIEYRIDFANALVLTLVSGVGALVIPFSLESILKDIDPWQTPKFYAAMLICLVGSLGVVITGDAFNVFVFLEIMSLSTYTLVALGAARDRRALTAAFNYLVMGTIGATFFVIGLGLLYQATGTLNMADVKAQIAANGANRMVEAGFAFILVGMGLKAAMFPLHLWMPNAYAYAPAAVTAFLAATSTKVAVYVIIRFIYSVIGPDFAFVGASLSFLLAPLAIAGMFAASIVAVFQSDVKRMLAYSSVAQIGYMLLGLSFASAAGLGASLTHLFNHGLMKGALFMAIAAVVWRTGSQRCDAFDGLFKRMPFTATCFLIGGLSLIGVPATAGFVSKWQLLAAAFESDRAWAAFLVVASSFIAVLYVGRIVERMIMKEPPEGAPRGEAPLTMLAPLALLTAANIFFGLDADLTVDVAREAAAALAGDGGAR
jgi:multicomponent Na+:H+ antiporter subunit D